MTGQDAHPDLICVGAQKAGTTWLDSVLRRMPQFYTPPFKELHYFSECHMDNVAKYAPGSRRKQALEVLDWVASLLPDPPQDQIDRLAMALHAATPITDDEWYRVIFTGAAPVQCRVEICPSYFDLPAAGIAHAFALNPALKVLILVRDPVERAWSHMRMLLDQEYIARQTDDLVPETLGPLWDAVVAYSNYITALSRWRAQARPEAIHLVPYDRIASEPEVLISDICDWAAVDSRPPPDDVRTPVFVGKDIPMPIKVRAELLGALEPQYGALAQDLPEEVENWHNEHLRCLGAPGRIWRGAAGTT